MDLNPIDAVEGAADAVGRKKRQLVKYIKGRSGVGGNAPIRGTGDRRPRYYTGGKRRPYRRP